MSPSTPPAHATSSGAPTSGAPEATLTTQAKVALGALGVAFVLLYFRWFLKQSEHSWDKLDDWGHAYVIPLISAAMLWRSRTEIARTAMEPFWPGILPALVGIVCYFFFVFGVPNHMLQGFSMILCLSGVVLLTLGPGFFRVAFLPLAYLAFGVTIAEQIMIRVTFPLQLLATQGAWLLLTLVSLPGNWFTVDASGNMIEVVFRGRTIPLNVAEACSGMRMVIAFIALAGAVAVFSCDRWWQRIAVLIIAVPVALFMNIIRVAVLAIASLYDVNLAAGNAHMVIGTLLLVPGMFLFLGTVWALKRIMVEPAEPAQS